VITNIEENDLALAGIYKLKQHAITTVYGKAPKGFELTMKTVRSETLIKGILAKERDTFLGC
jgi:hypothetical protein